MPRNRSNLATTLLAAVGIVALFKARTAMSRLSDAVKNLSDAAAAAVASNTALRQENDTLRSQLADSQANAASDDEVATIEHATAELQSITQATPAQP